MSRLPLGAWWPGPQWQRRPAFAAPAAPPAQNKVAAVSLITQRANTLHCSSDDQYCFAGVLMRTTPWRGLSQRQNTRPPSSANASSQKQTKTIEQIPCVFIGSSEGRELELLQ